MARQPQAGLDHVAASCSAGSSAGVRGITSNPTIFAEGDRGPATTTTTSSASSSTSGTPVEDVYWELVTHDIEDALAHPAAGVRRQRRRATASSRSRSRPSSPATPTAPSRPPAQLCTSRSTSPNLFVKIPGTAEGLPAIQQMIARGQQHQRHAAVRRSSATARSSRPTCRGLEALAATGGDLSHGRQRRVVLRQPGRHRGRPPARAIGTPRGARAAGQGRRRQRASSPTSCSSSGSPATAGSAWPPRAPACSARCGRRRRRRTRRTPTRSTSTRSSVPTPSTPCPTHTSTTSRTTARGPHRRRRSAGAHAVIDGLAAGRHRHARRHRRPSRKRASRRSPSPSTSCCKRCATRPTRSMPDRPVLAERLLGARRHAVARRQRGTGNGWGGSTSTAAWTTEPTSCRPGPRRHRADPSSCSAWAGRRSARSAAGRREDSAGSSCSIRPTLPTVASVTPRDASSSCRRSRGRRSRSSPLAHCWDRCRTAALRGFTLTRNEARQIGQASRGSRIFETRRTSVAATRCSPTSGLVPAALIGYDVLASRPLARGPTRCRGPIRGDMGEAGRRAGTR